MWWSIFVFSIMGLISYQDFKNREIGWYGLFSLLVIGLSYRSLYSLWGIEIITSYVYLAVILGLLWLYFSVRYKKIYNFIDKDLGLGDVLMFLIMPLFMHVTYFMFYFITCMIVGMFLGMLYYSHKRKTIPLASIMAIVYCLLYLYSPSLYIGL